MNIIMSHQCEAQGRPPRHPCLLEEPSRILRPADTSDAHHLLHAMYTRTHQPTDMLAPPPHRATSQQEPPTGLHLSMHGISLGTPVLPAAGPSCSRHRPHERHPQGHPGGTHCDPSACQGPWQITPTRSGLRLSSEECARVPALGFGPPSTAARQPPMFQVTVVSSTLAGPPRAFGPATPRSHNVGIQDLEAAVDLFLEAGLAETSRKVY